MLNNPKEIYIISKNVLFNQKKNKSLLKVKLKLASGYFNMPYQLPPSIGWYSGKNKIEIR